MNIHSINRLLWVGLAALLCTLLAGPALAVTPIENEIQKLLASDGAIGDQFGVSVALDGDTALVGAFLDDDNGVDSGSAYLFQWNGSAWVQQAKLLPADGAANDRFGIRVALDGDRALVGASLDDDSGFNSGSAYLFQWDGSAWIEQAKLQASDSAAFFNFGRSVALDGDAALIGARNVDGNLTVSGSAYLFHWDGSAWVEEAKLLASDAAGIDDFGSSVALDGDTALVGAPTQNGNDTNSGAAYLFRWDGSNWTEIAKLLASDGASFDDFGMTVALDDDTALIGAPANDDNGSNSGSAYLFRWDGGAWAEQAKLLPSDGASGDLFGGSVALNGDTALVGAVRNDDNGSAYLFLWNGGAWVEQTKLLASDGASLDLFGGAVALDGDRALIGARGNDDNGSNSGSAYLFELYPAGYDWQGFFAPVDNLPTVNTVKGGQTVPIKWRIPTADGGYIRDTAIVTRLEIAEVNCAAEGTEYENAIEAETTGSSGLHYELTDEQFIYNWKTSKSMKNSCQLFILGLDDGSYHYAKFKVK